MIVSRANFKTNDIDRIERPFKLDYGAEELIFTFDQSSTCTGLTIGNMKGQVRELITFERENRKGEETGQYLSKMEMWVKVLLSNLNVKCYSIEDVILTNYARSDKVVKQVRGVLVNLFHTASCINKDGESTLLAVNSEIEEINNKEWKSSIIPKDYFDYYKDDKLAVANYIGKHIPITGRMRQDITDSISMYLFLIKTKYGSQKLKATKSSINTAHNLVVLAFPYEDVTRNHEPLRALGDGKLGGKFNKAQLEYIDKYRESVVKRYLGLLVGIDYIDEYIESNKAKIDTKLAKYLKMKSEKEFAEMISEAKWYSLTDEQRKFREFEFNDGLTLEENLRCFTSRDKGMYFTVMPKSLHYCYTIPMFDLLLGMNDEILIVATKY